MMADLASIFISEKIKISARKRCSFTLGKNNFMQLQIVSDIYFVRKCIKSKLIFQQK